MILLPGTLGIPRQHVLQEQHELLPGDVKVASFFETPESLPQSGFACVPFEAVNCWKTQVGGTS